MFKVTKPEFVNKTFRMPVDLVKRLEKVAQNEGVSVNALVIQCCEYALDKLAEEDEAEK
jgi:predicted HicB family RNase H-like nuclease